MTKHVPVFAKTVERETDILLASIKNIGKGFTARPDRADRSHNNIFFANLSTE